MQPPLLPSLETLQKKLGARGLPGRRSPGAGGVAGPLARNARCWSRDPPASARPTSPGRWPRRSRASSFACSATRGSTRRRRSTSGTTPSRCSTRSSFARPCRRRTAGAATLAEAADRVAGGRRGVLQPPLPRRAAAPPRADERDAGGHAHRRGRSRRSRVRGVPAGGAGRGAGDHPGARDHAREAPRRSSSSPATARAR